MNLIVKLLVIAIVSITVLGCNDQQQSAFEPKVVYQSDDLVVTQITENAYQHVSYLQTNDFGKVPCNGLIVRDNNEVIIFDTPTNDKSSETLIKWIKETLHCKINAIVPTHFHNDCLGGLKAFEDNGVPSYSYFKTVELAKENDLVVPQNSFTDSLTLKVGNQKVMAKYFGEGHTIDNVIGYFPAENIMFGGCLIKESDATKGYLGDANIEEWSNTVEKVKEAYPQVKIIIPGHGAYGNQQLLDYTIQLFRNK
ncbi:subclass B1 metallo-beta-lactamase [Gynurincola endophyticus]|uniref:subclass B1 metallo-beta-lactamase n=1 Tax=Gynurincola endophyticus TaxID=2479004 RepID=UPI000F8CE885|nr:subclass B1 metallo-beta-lactamase [Gynurincola endophyticus]